MKDFTQGSVTRHLLHVWYLSVGSIILQMCVNLLLLRHELRKRLRFEEPETFIPASATAS
jgi:hypothetical protein